jgi:hypothetical protein
MEDKNQEFYDPNLIERLVNEALNEAYKEHGIYAQCLQIWNDHEIDME